MGLADTVTKAYMKENTVFADAFNYLIYGGKAVVNPAPVSYTHLGTYVNCATPFGYRQQDHQLVLEKDEAAVVRLVFEKYLSGVGIRCV